MSSNASKAGGFTSKDSAPSSQARLPSPARSSERVWLLSSSTNRMGGPTPTPSVRAATVRFGIHDPLDRARRNDAQA